MSAVEVVAQGSAFDASAYDLPIPKDRYGRKADKLLVTLGSWEPDRTSEDDLEVFAKLERGQYVELRVRAFVTTVTEVSKTSPDFERGDYQGEDATEIRRVLHVHTIEVA